MADTPAPAPVLLNPVPASLEPQHEGGGDNIETWSYSASSNATPSKPMPRFQPPPEDAFDPTIATSTFAESKGEVSNKSMIDPYGDRGDYTGAILISTGHPHGRGIMVYEEPGRTYEGDWRHGRWNGRGRATFGNGDTYEGEYIRGERHGQGRYEWKDGRVYEGEFRENKRHGRGKFTWPNGAVFEGLFENGKRVQG